MNRHQGLVLAVVAGNIALMLLFPPYDALGMLRGGQSFDAFYFALEGHPGKVPNSGMLLLELYWILINGSLAWWLLRGGGSKGDGISRRTVALLFAAVNLAFVFLFPPLENYPSTLRAGTYFDGFYFVFGDKWQRHLYVPLLYMEVLWVLINGAVVWLLMRDDPVPAQTDDEELAA